MEARTAPAIPEGDRWWYEPKWDGFRALAFKHGDKVELQSKAGKDLARYFPELIARLESVPAGDFVLDGEIVIPVGRSLSFDALLQRIHPAASRVAKLAAETPASLVVFDLLADGARGDLTALPLERRREKLEAFAVRQFTKGAGSSPSRLLLSPVAKELSAAKAWLDRAGVGLDGLVAKRRDLPYLSGERSPGMVKIKFKRTADCVVGGYRLGSDRPQVGSLLLGLYDAKGLLNHVGFTTTLHFPERAALTKKLAAIAGPPGFTGSRPDGPSRWSTERTSQWIPVQPRLVVEVEFDHFSGDRFRHGTRFLRWRPEKRPDQCTEDQVRRESGAALLILSPRSRKSRSRRA
jgi:ATP-dependent DNA ligase